MAPKRPSPLDEPPAASSSEGEETSSGEDEEGVSRGGSSSEEEEDDEETQTQKPKKSSALPSTPAAEKKIAPKKSESAVNSQAQSSSSESGSGSESDSDTESGRNVKPITSKPMPLPIPMEDSPKPKKPRSKQASLATPSRSSLKRPSETTTKDSKRTKKGSDADDGVFAEDESKKSVDESKKLFQRLWSEDDEIAILNGMIDYTAKKGADPALDMNAFHDFIKKSLHVDVTKAQLMDKIRRLKKKYKNNADRGKKGADPTFSKPHEQKGYELSKRIWGGSANAEQQQHKPNAANAANANGTPKKNQRGSSSSSRSLASLKAELVASPDVVFPKEDGDKNKMTDHNNIGGSSGWCSFDKSFLGAVGLPESFLKQGLELIGKSKRTELEEEWRKLHLAELELFLKRTELVRDQAKSILDAYNSSSSDK